MKTPTEQRLVCTPSACDDSDHAAGAGFDDLLRSTRKLDPRLSLVWIVADHGDIVPGCPSQCTSIPGLLFHIRDHRPLRDGAQRKDIAHCQVCLFTGVDKLTSVHSLVGDKGFGMCFVAVRIAEGHLGKRSPPTRVVNDLFNDTANIAMSFRIVKSSELGRGFIETSVSR